jgi:hypothetical protein
MAKPLTDKQLKTVLRKAPTAELIDEVIRRWEQEINDHNYTKGCHKRSAQIAYEIAHSNAFHKRWG